MTTIDKEDLSEIEDAPLFEKFLKARKISFKQRYFVLGYMYDIPSVKNCGFFVDELLFLSGVIPLGYLTTQTDGKHFTNHFKKDDYLTHDKIPLMFKHVQGDILLDFMSWRMEHCL